MQEVLLAAATSAVPPAPRLTPAFERIPGGPLPAAETQHMLVFFEDTDGRVLFLAQTDVWQVPTTIVRPSETRANKVLHCCSEFLGFSHAQRASIASSTQLRFHSVVGFPQTFVAVCNLPMSRLSYCHHGEPMRCERSAWKTKLNVVFDAYMWAHWTEFSSVLHPLPDNGELMMAIHAVYGVKLL